MSRRSLQVRKPLEPQLLQLLLSLDTKVFPTTAYTPLFGTNRDGELDDEDFGRSPQLLANYQLRKRIFGIAASIANHVGCSKTDAVGSGKADFQAQAAFEYLDMTRPARCQEYYFDPRVHDGYGPIPAWGLTHQGAKRQEDGKHRRAFIWPRDKGKTNSPPISLRRWKDILTGKGPDIFIGREGSLRPHRPQWSNWTDTVDGMTLDNLGYRDNTADMLRLGHGFDQRKRYDFRTRKYGTPHLGMWSDVKWEKRRHPKNALYHRDAVGVETFEHVPDGLPPVNPFVHDPWTRYMDWARPQPDPYDFGEYEPHALRHDW
ncbi:hypothetical protein MMC13_001390 [Lambiella insularis]|nr:hypothetical protein [Lambiella insularis]